ncbi:hypothetical protein M231_04480 [Tremella mesenterica]|uniref:Uncharacterized protein n=1 Tax=Tremella mesenterica TaxID=5217 RepID=A0A4V1M3W7_TREME|nr:hypothetical protein M231_04480 [Tremella mesenterica]
MLPTSHLCSTTAGPSTFPTPTQTTRRRVRSIPAEPLASPKPNPRAKSLVDSFRSLSPRTRMLFGLTMGVVGIGWWMADKMVPVAKDEKPLISVRIVDRVSSNSLPYCCVKRLNYTLSLILSVL